MHRRKTTLSLNPSAPGQSSDKMVSGWGGSPLPFQEPPWNSPLKQPPQAHPTGRTPGLLLPLRTPTCLQFKSSLTSTVVSKMLGRYGPFHSFPHIVYYPED